jgi:MFS family permease
LSLRFFDELGGFLPAGTFESFRADLHLNYAHASMVLVAAAPGAIAGNGFSIAADHHSRRVIASIGTFGYALALLGLAFGRSFAVFLAAGFALGLFATAMIDAGELALLDVAGEQAYDRLAHSYFISCIGDIAGPALLIAVTAIGFSWRVAFGVAALLMIGFGIWLATLPLPPPHAQPDLGGVRDGMRELLRTPAVWWVGACAFLVSPLDESFLAFLIAKLQQTNGMSLPAATLVATATIVGTAAGFGLAPRLRQASVSSGAVLLVAGAMIAGTAPWPPVIVVGALVFGFGLARAWMAVKIRAIAIRPERRGTVSAVVSTIEFTGFVLPLAAGVVADRYGLTAGLACYVAMAAVLVGVGYASKARAI